MPPLAHFTSGPAQSSTFTVHARAAAKVPLWPSLEVVIAAAVVQPLRHTHSVVAATLLPPPVVLQGTAFGPHCCSTTADCLSLCCRSHSSTSKYDTKFCNYILLYNNNIMLYNRQTAGNDNNIEDKSSEWSSLVVTVKLYIWLKIVINYNKRTYLFRIGDHANGRPHTHNANRPPGQCTILRSGTGAVEWHTRRFLWTTRNKKIRKLHIFERKNRLQIYYIILFGDCFNMRLNPIGLQDFVYDIIVYNMTAALCKFTAHHTCRTCLSRRPPLNPF